VEVERTREGGVTSANNRKSGAISHYDEGKEGEEVMVTISGLAGTSVVG
jgi:hypothetical protein